MGRIGASISGIERALLNRLNEANSAATMYNYRLATGKNINSPKDGPAAFMSLSNFQMHLNLVNHASNNVAAAGSLVSHAQTSLNSIRTQLQTIRTELLKDEDRSLDASERAEAQANIDEAIAQINTLATTTFEGRRLLDGSAAFGVSGRDSSQVAELNVYSTGRFSTQTAPTQTISGEVVEAATQAELTYEGKSGAASVKADATFTLTGEAGSVEFTVAEDDALADLAEQINDASHKTGVTAAVAGDVLTFSSTGYGSDVEISIDVDPGGTFEVEGGNGDGTAVGTDAVVEINGHTYGPAEKQAQRAQLVHEEATGTLASAADITLTGSLGSASISLGSGDTLQQAADAINAEKDTTGVKAEVNDEGTQLILQRVERGAEEFIQIDTTSGTFTTTDHYDPAQTASFAHYEPTGQITNNTEIRVQSNSGAWRNITLASGDSLQTAADKINAETALSGIYAWVNDDNLIVESVDSGDDAWAFLRVLSGTFEVNGEIRQRARSQGSDPRSIAHGADVATENVEAAAASLRHESETGLIENDAVLRLYGDSGSEYVELEAGQTLEEAATAIRAVATGVTATVEGDELVISTVSRGAESYLSAEVVHGQLELTADNYTAGQKATVTHSTPDGTLQADADIRLVGMNGAWDFSFTAGQTIQEAADAINTWTGTTGVEATTSGDDLLIQSISADEHAFVDFLLLGGTFDVSGIDVEGMAYTTTATAYAEGAAEVSGLSDAPRNTHGNEFTYNENGFHYDIRLAEGFEGEFDTMTVSGDALTFSLSTDLHSKSTLAVPNMQAAALGGPSGTLSEIASGGLYAGLDENTSRAIRIVDEALGDLERAAGSVDGFYNAQISSASDVLDDAKTNLEETIEEVDGYNEDENTLLLNKELALAANAQAGLAILYQQQMSLLAMIQQQAGIYSSGSYFSS